MRYVKSSAFNAAIAAGLTLTLCLVLGAPAWAAGQTQADRPTHRSSVLQRAHHDPYAGYKTSTSPHAGFYSSANRNRTFTRSRTYSGYYAQFNASSTPGSARSLADTLAHRRNMTGSTYPSQRTVVTDHPRYVSPSGSSAYIIHNPRRADPPAADRASRRTYQPQTDQMTERLWNHANRDVHAPQPPVNTPLITHEYRPKAIHSPTTNLYARKIAQDLARRRSTQSALDAHYRQYYRTENSNVHLRLRFHDRWNTYRYPRYPYRYDYNYIYTYPYPLQDCGPDIFLNGPTFPSQYGYGFHHPRFRGWPFHHHGLGGWSGFHHVFGPGCVRSGITIWFNF